MGARKWGRKHTHTHTKEPLPAHRQHKVWNALLSSPCDALLASPEVSVPQNLSVQNRALWAIKITNSQRRVEIAAISGTLLKAKL